MFSKQWVKYVLASTAALLVILGTNAGVAGAVNPSTAATTKVASSPSGRLPSCSQLIPFDPGNFPNSTRIDNKFFPLVPGTKFTLDGTTSDGAGGTIPHQIVTIVTDLTKEVNGVRTPVIWDRDFQDGQLIESELYFPAQDKFGNVWLLGELPVEVSDGVNQGAPSAWISGQQGADPGIAMLASPQSGTPSYRQGYAPSVGFYDCGQVFQTGQKIATSRGTFKEVLVTNEWSPIDQAGGIQQKFNAPGVGVIQVTAIDDPQAETLQLKSVERLTAKTMDQVRAEALKLDSYGYEVSNVYRATSPAQKQT